MHFFMKNLFLVLISFAFTSVALQAQTDATSIPGDAVGTYILFGTDATVVVSSTGIVGNTGGSNVSDGSGGTTSGTGGTGAAGASSGASDDSSSPAVGLHGIKKSPKGWGGTYTTEDGTSIPVMLELRVDNKGRRGILVMDRAGTVVARYQRS